MLRPVIAMFLLALAAAPGAFAQQPEPPMPDRLPDGRSRELAILKEDHEKTLEDIAEIRKLAAELEEEIEEQTAHVTSLESLRKAEKIEELAQRLQKRMKRIP
jgi:hypothetical protein